MQVRRGFHRLGLVRLVPLAIAAGISFLFAAYMFATGKPTAVYVVTGPDGRRWEWKGENVSYSGIEQWLTNTCGKPIRFGTDVRELEGRSLK